MKSFIEKHPFWFALAFVIVVMEALGFAAAAFTIKVLGLEGLPVRLAAVLTTTIAPLLIIYRIGWWRDAGFVETVQNSSALTVPLLKMFFPLALVGTIATAPDHAMMLVALVVLTAISEEAVYRGLFIRAFLPMGTWQAVLLSTGLFAAAHFAQSIGGNMGIAENLTQVANAFFGGVLYCAVRLRINSLWPLILLHTIYDLFYLLGGLFDGVFTLSDIPTIAYVIVWVVSIVATVYLMRKPSVVTIEAKSAA